MSVTFTRTREQIAKLALSKLRVIDPKQALKASDADTAYEAIDLRLKELHAMGELWRKVSGTTSQNLTLTAGQQTATAPTDLLLPLKIMARLNGDDYQVEIIGPMQYAAIPTKTEQGEPLYAFLSGGSFYFWPVPNKSGTASLTYEKIIDDTAQNTAPDVGQAFMRALVDLVKYDLADQYHVEEARMSRYAAEAAQAMITIRRLNALPVDIVTTEADYF